MKYIYSIFIFVIPFLIIFSCVESNQTDLQKSQTVKFAKEILVSTLKKTDSLDSVSVNFSIDNSLSESPQSYRINVTEDTINISAAAEAGILYGCLYLRDEIQKSAALPEDFEFSNAPLMQWRGISLQLMKLGTYNYAITPEEFPFFYDKELWIKFMNFMVNQRFNYIILWNGHPFDYFVKFDKYKEAQSGMTAAQIEKNNAMLKWLIAEGKKRNIKFFFEFYNIHTSIYYQAAHNLPEQISKPTDELAAYTKYSISKFVTEFPDVGLFVTPGEGLQREYSDEWINNVIFKAVNETGQNPVIFMRAWFFDLTHARKVVGNYDNLYFVRKFNVEMIADKRTDPENSTWAKLNGNFIVNIHLSANLEPFRWNPPSYIQSIVKNNIESGANGIHLHPRKAWRWPYGSDKGLDTFQWQRDSLFFTAWSRYAWNPDREITEEQKYWTDLLTRRYGDKKAAKHFLNSFEAGSDVLPGLQRLIWLGYDNHTIITAGATLLQLKNSKGIPFLSIEPTLRISEYVEALKSGKEMGTQTPLQFVEQKVVEAKKSLDEAKLALPFATRNLSEAKRIVSDAQAVLYTTEFYLQKIQALRQWILLQAEINNGQNQKLFLSYLEASVNTFSKLTQITSKNYESMSDVSARHPLRLKKVPYHWKDLLPIYQKELQVYKTELTAKRAADYYEPIFNGLAGIFYSEPNYVDAEEAYYADAINFNWDNDSEIGRRWSVKWFGFLKAPLDGDIEIKFSADREAVLSIGAHVININNSTQSKKALWNFKSGRSYPIEISYDHQNGEGGFIKLEWSWDGHRQEVIPAEYLFHSQSQRSKIDLIAKLNEAMQ